MSTHRHPAAATTTLIYRHWCRYCAHEWMARRARAECPTCRAPARCVSYVIPPADAPSRSWSIYLVGADGADECVASVGDARTAEEALLLARERCGDLHQPSRMLGAVEEVPA